MAMIELPTGRQTFDFDCGAKALQILMAYYGMDISEGDLMKELKCDAHGCPVQNMISVAEAKGFQVVRKSGLSLEEVKRYVDEKHPVLVLVQAWAERFMTLEDWKSDDDDGHYVIVIAHADGVIVFEDPSSFHRTWLTEEEFMARWHDVDPRTHRRLEHFGMVLLGKKPMPPEKTLEHMD
jgi:predicted double-glycine peptidase